MTFNLSFAFQGFGRANHKVTTEKLKVRYPDYEVTWANDGYWAPMTEATVGTQIGFKLICSKQKADDLESPGRLKFAGQWKDTRERGEFCHFNAISCQAIFELLLKFLLTCSRSEEETSFIQLPGIKLNW